jgi:hypothetical protein
LQEGRPFGVVFFLFEVLPPVHLDDQFALWGTEIGDIGTYRVLAAEVDVRKAVGAQVSP